MAVIASNTATKELHRHRLTSPVPLETFSIQLAEALQARPDQPTSEALLKLFTVCATLEPGVPRAALVIGFATPQMILPSSVSSGPSGRTVGQVSVIIGSTELSLQKAQVSPSKLPPLVCAIKLVLISKLSQIHKKGCSHASQLRSGQ